MINRDYFFGKKVIVVGLARSGIAVARLLKRIGAQVWVSDYTNNESMQGIADELRHEGIEVELGVHTEDFVKGKDLLVLSPGVSNESLPVRWAQANSIPILSEIEVAWKLCPAKVIAVTGSNGKTTVTTLIGRIIAAAGKRAHVCGNIGNPFSAVIENVAGSDYVVLEVSSFQLERIVSFKPAIAVIVNLTPNHLDRYTSMDEYIQAKMRITLNQDKNDYLIYSQADSLLQQYVLHSNATLVGFLHSDEFNANQAAVIEVGKILGIELDVMKEVFRNFKGIEHRMEFVATIGGRTFINDSKSTTADATIWALSNLKTQIVLIAGGKHKGIDYRVIAQSAGGKVKHVIVFGQAADLISQALSDFTCTHADSLAHAVRSAFANSQKGDTILFSPMCSSFDMFKNYEERGVRFKEEVKALLAEKSP